MEAAKNAINKITSRHGHTTEVDERVQPAVVSETVKPHRHEETTQAVDREVHQHHFHTTVQPVADKQVLPEKHHHVQAPVIEKEYRHDNEAETQQRVSAELGQFKNTSRTVETTQSREAAPTVTGEHVHHHVHETVQPVIHKETVQPEVVHTTVPVHEVHHANAQHHGISALPMKTLDEFKQIGGSVTGNQTRAHEEYDGPPRPYNDKLSTTIDKVLPGHHSTHNTTGMSNTDRSGLSGTSSHNGRPDSGVGGIGHDKHNTTGLGHDNHNKPSLADKLNPRVDADRDGKAGIMD